MRKKRAVSVRDIAERRYEDLTRFLRYRLAGKAEAQDLAQEAFMRLLRRSREHLIERPEAYLFRIAANLAYEQRLNGAITADFDALEAAGELADESMAPERRAIGQERLRRLEQALADLPPLPRAAFALQRRDGLSYAEIAERLNTTPHMVKKHISAALQRCRHVLSIDDDE